MASVLVMGSLSVGKLPRIALSEICSWREAIGAHRMRIDLAKACCGETISVLRFSSRFPSRFPCRAFHAKSGGNRAKTGTRAISSPRPSLMTKQIRLNAFAMNCVAHQSPGLWTHPRDRTIDYHKLSYWIDLAKTLE